MTSNDEHAEINQDAARRTTKKPYSSHHPVPNIHQYQERQEERRRLATPNEDTESDSKLDRFKDFFRSKDNKSSTSVNNGALYENKNQNAERLDPNGADGGGQSADPHNNGDAEEVSKQDFGQDKGRGNDDNNNDGSDGGMEDTSEVTGDQSNPRAKRKAMKNRDTGGDRQVTDPVTHLQTSVHDYTQQELEQAPRSLSPERVGTGMSSGKRSSSDLEAETRQLRDGDRASKHLFPPPSSKLLQRDLSDAYKTALQFGLNAMAAVLLLALFVGWFLQSWLQLQQKTTILVTGGFLVSCSILAAGINWMVGGWLSNRVESVFEDHVWHEAYAQERKIRSDVPESTMWLNSFLASVWPLINPDLFTSIADTLEDVMQASLNPKVVRMVAVKDLGQGSIAPRILGARWLPTGAASQTVSVDGKKKPEKDDGNNDRKVPGQGQIEDADDSDDDTKDQAEKNDSGPKDEDQRGVSEGLEAESGDFTNLELMFSYRSNPKGEGIKDKSKAAHLYLVFYLPGNIPFPVYVSLRGIVGKMRIRLQLSPDPPFVNLCTLTLLGQPKADISCIPLARKMLNIMDLPVISSFVQSSIDAALSEYVAPRSLTLDLKQMLQGDDFKKNTEARGVVVAHIKRAYDFKEADTGTLGIGDSSSDSYVSVGWAKFGKPIWSTRVIIKDMEPYWQETAYILVGPEEVNAEESLRVQLWDSDRMSADDDLGRIEISLAELMEDSKGKMVDRSDGFIAMDADEKMPGKLDWQIGYFEKVQITDDQFQAQTFDTEIRGMQQLKDRVSKDANRKLREADRDISDEADQQKAQDFEEHADSLISAAPPPKGYPTGILSIQVHNITGLQLADLKKDRNSEGDEYEGSSEDSGDLPSAYATIILNGRPVFRTRTKPKNAKPFFNASTERFVRDWRNAEAIIAVRDARTHEDDPLLGFVYLPLEQLFANRSQVDGTYPISGGSGFGRMRVSLVFRAVGLELPKTLLGWDFGTLEITGAIRSDDLEDNLKGLKIKCRTSHGKGKLHSSSNQGEWKVKKDRKIRMAVSSRYSSTVVFEFRSGATFGDKLAAFAILWLKDVPDDEDQEIQLPVWRGKSFDRAKANCISEMGERAGTLTVSMKFYSGLSEYHKPMAKERPEMGQVMEVLDAASDQKEREDDIPGDGDGTDSSSNSSEDEERDGLEKDGSRNALSSVKEYKKHHKVLHRQQKGVMQWKTARTANWLKTKVDHAAGKMTNGVFSHHNREPGVETEV